MEHFDRAIGHDPLYAPAYAGLANAYGAMAYHGFMDQAEAASRARAAGRRALDLDPDLPDAHLAFALGYLFNEMDWARSEEEFKRAIALDPKHAQAQAFYGLVLSALRRTDEAVAQARLGLQLDPLSLVLNVALSWALYFARRFQEAADQARRTLEIAPDFAVAHNIIAGCKERLGDFRGAAAALARFHQCIGLPDDDTNLARAFEEGGAGGYWRARLALLEGAASGRFGSSPNAGFAAVYAQLGDVDRALQYLETAVNRREGMAVFLAVEPAFDPLRAESRFTALLDRVGLPK